jgi:hypothetical protein
MFSLTTVSAVVGLLLLVSSIAMFVSYGPGTWTAWVALVSSLLSLYAVYLKLFPPAL